MPEPLFRHIGDHGGRQIHTHVRGNQQILQFLEHVVVETPARSVRTGAHGIGQAPNQAAGRGVTGSGFAALRPVPLPGFDKFVDAGFKP